MEWLLAGGELLGGVAALVLWWLVLKLVSGDGDKPLTNTRFVVYPAIFLLWLVGSIILILDGVGVV